MPRSKREKVLHLTQVSKKTREHKDRLLSAIRDAVPEYEHCFVVRLDNARNQHIQEMRQALSTDGSGQSKLFLGKTKLMARALGMTPEEAVAPGIESLATRYLQHGSTGLLLTNRRPDDLQSYLASLCPVDFARAGTVATRDVILPTGPLFSTGGTVAAADDVPVALALEPELRRLGVPTRVLDGKVVLEGVDETVALEKTEKMDKKSKTKGGYTICRTGQTLDSRQSRLLRHFGICLSEFRVEPLAYWSTATAAVTELVKPPSAPGNKKAATAEDVMVEDDDGAGEA